MSERLWAGWRMAYLRGAGVGANTPEDCLFCGLSAQEPSPRNLILERYRHAFLVLNAFPYTSGHLMVVPYRHAEDLLSENEAARGEILAGLDRARVALTREYGPQGFNVGANLGRAAGAGVVGHLHWHLVPRWVGDTNFAPVVAEVRVIPEALPETYARLVSALAQIAPQGVTLEGRGDVA
jgi:ATP adenylyltransferase